MHCIRKLAFATSQQASFAKYLSTSSKNLNKVALLGAAGGIGQPLGLLLKTSSRVSKLALYDVANAPGVAADLSHIETKAKVTSHADKSQLADALNGADIVVIPAGVPRKPGMTRDDLFNTNASIVADLTYACAKYSPKAMICIITNPVNSTVPIAREILKSEGVYDKNRLFGVTTLDIIRSNTFIAEAKGLDVTKVSCPVVGGHSGVTILPVISQCTPSASFPDDARKEITKRIQNAGTEVVEAKAGAGSATLSMAYAGARFTESLLKAMGGMQGIVECAFVESTLVKGCEFFASQVLLGPEGVAKILDLGNMNNFEIEQLAIAEAELKKNIAKGIKFAQEYKPS